MNQHRDLSHSVLLVDDEEQFLRSAGVSLRVAGFKVAACSKSSEALTLLEMEKSEIALLDIMMPGISGTALLAEIKRTHPEIPVIMITAVNDVKSAVECMRLGAFDYLVKPVEKSRLVSTVNRAFEMVEMRNENLQLKRSLFKDRLEHPEFFDGIVTRNALMFSIFQYIEAIACTPMPVLITGETGTGKQMIAQAIHRASGRKGEFVSIDIAGLGDSLFSDTMFGHEKGAFTGADSRRDGLVAKAAGGSLFLDEIGDLAPEAQVKLLRLLEEKSFYPVGSDSARLSTARIIAATNRDLNSMRQAGSFRNDLYFRLQSHLIHLPPLRERPDDVPLLIDTFTDDAARQLGKEPPEVEDMLYSLLEAYSFPGNVRELKLMLFNAVSIEKSGFLSADTVRSRLDNMQSPALPLSNSTPDAASRARIFSHPRILPTLKEAEEFLVAEALRRADGNQTIAAQLLGMTRSALNKRLIRSRSAESE